jgi:uncharacterized protein
MVQHPGKFVWFEHFSSDIDQARRFYESLVDWRVMAVPLGVEFYHLAMNGQDGLAGFRIMPPGARPGWMSYLSVRDVDAACDQAEAAGATVLMRPTRFAPMGRGACLVDPTGAVFSIWTAALGDRPDVDPPPAGDWCWNELMTPEPEAALAFYCQAFDFDFKTVPMPDGSPYHLLIADGVQRAGIMALPRLDMPAHWLPYLAVKSVDVMLERGEALGARVLVPGRDIPEIGRFGVIEDPSGAAVAVYTGTP